MFAHSLDGGAPFSGPAMSAGLILQQQLLAQRELQPSSGPDAESGPVRTTRKPRVNWTPEVSFLVQSSPPHPEQCKKKKKQCGHGRKSHSQQRCFASLLKVLQRAHFIERARRPICGVLLLLAA